MLSSDPSPCTELELNTPRASLALFIFPVLKNLQWRRFHNRDVTGQEYTLGSLPTLPLPSPGGSDSWQKCRCRRWSFASKGRCHLRRLLSRCMSKGPKNQSFWRGDISSARPTSTRNYISQKISKNTLHLFTHIPVPPPLLCCHSWKVQDGTPHFILAFHSGTALKQYLGLMLCSRIPPYTTVPQPP